MTFSVKYNGLKTTKMNTHCKRKIYHSASTPIEALTLNPTEDLHTQTLLSVRYWHLATLC